LTSYDDYRDSEKPEKKNRNSHVGHPINAVVVRQYRNALIEPNEWPVFLTNGSVEHPFDIYDDYDNRSLIEIYFFVKVNKAGIYSTRPHARRAE
jgi:hypothetical protein